MAMDVIRLFYDHLRALPARAANAERQIDLFLHSNGGDGVVPWRLVSLIREYCDNFAVIVPHRAFSAATITALGANEIVMHPLGMLGPIDPTTTNAFNPRDTQGNQLGISVEDVAAYVSLVKEDVGITHEDELVQAFNILAQQVHPLALGNVKRTTQQSRMLARKLLGLHLDRTSDDHKIDKIVEALTSRLYYHGHPINRAEARNDLDLPVVEPAPEIEETIWSLYKEYESEMSLTRPFIQYQEFLNANPDLSTVGQMQVIQAPPVTLAYVESETISHRFRMSYEISGARQPNMSIQTSQLRRSQGWEEEV